MTTMRRDYGDSSEDITYCGDVTSRCNIKGGTYILFSRQSLPRNSLHHATYLTTTLANVDSDFEAALKLMEEYESFPERNDAE